MGTGLPTTSIPFVSSEVEKLGLGAAFLDCARNERRLVQYRYKGLVI
jgi:hypothetical protein